VTPREPKGTFDRLRPRSEAEQELREQARPAGTVDAEGKRALFSQTASAPAFGAVTVECSSCGAETVMTAAQWVRSALPSLHLPGLRKRYPSWMRCPACGTRTWVKAHFRV
jgi:uncharacterized protein with PIN domain